MRPFVTRLIARTWVCRAGRFDCDDIGQIRKTALMRSDTPNSGRMRRNLHGFFQSAMRAARATFRRD
jgi:hypothetical protein